MAKTRCIRNFLSFTVLILLVLFTGCASTVFLAEWKDETYHGHPHRILVINAFANPENRKIFEDAFVKALQDRGSDAIAGYTFMPASIDFERSTLSIYAKSCGADTVLTNKPVGTSKDTTIGAGGITYDDLYVNTKTDIYDIGSGRLIMSASAETWVRQGESYGPQIRSYVGNLVKKLSRLGLF